MCDLVLHHPSPTQLVPESFPGNIVFPVRLREQTAGAGQEYVHL